MNHTHRGLTLATALLGVFSLFACSNSSSSGGTTGKGEAKQGAGPTVEAKQGPPAEMNLLIWPDYIDEKILKDFETKNNARVRLTRYDSTEEMESKLAYAGADSQYDVVILASQVLPRMVRRGLVRPLDHSKLTNIRNLDTRFSGPNFDNGNKHAIPYQWGLVGILYNKKKLPELEPSWTVLFDPKKVPGTFELMDEQRDMLGVTLKYKGYSSNTTSTEEIQVARSVLKETKAHPKCLGFKGGVGAAEDVKAGSTDMAVVWNGDAQKAIREDKDQRLAFVIPKEGSVLWVDVMAIAAKAPNPDLAHRFVNHLLIPEVGAQLSMYTKYATPNAVAQTKLPDEDRNNTLVYPSQEVSLRLEHHRDIGDAAKVFDEVWTDVKSQ